VRKATGYLGVRMLLAAVLLVVLGVCAGAAVPGTGTASANGDNGGNFHQCSGGVKTPDDPNTPEFEQTCTITAATGTCVQRSDAPEVMQRCTFTQSSGPNAVARNLRATAIQIHNPEVGPNGTQDAFQVIEVSQTNLAPGKSDYLDAKQIADQCLGLGDNFEDADGDRKDEDRDGDRDDDGRCEDGEEEDNDAEEAAEDENGPLFPDTIMQSQRATQTIDVFQKAVGIGKTVTYAFQDQHLHQRAANADAIIQEQNLVQRDNECGEVQMGSTVGIDDPLDSNACFSIQQVSDQAKSAKLLQVYNLFQSARNAGDGRQDQGDLGETLGGLEHNFDQEGGTGIATQLSNQVERLKQRRVNIFPCCMPYHQFAGPKKSIGLQDDPNSTARMNQDVVVSSTGTGFDFGTQGVLLEINCTSTLGNCTGTQRARTNDPEASYDDMQSGTSITMLARCETFEGEGSGGECFPVGG
jgi:hypothetical protein